MSDDRRVYSEAEFAIILRRAAELTNAKERDGLPSEGLTLAEIKAAATEAGIDPALVERSARLLPANSSASVIERVLGGPLRHGMEIHSPVTLDEARAAQLLAAVQISAGKPGSGHSSSLGMVWHAQDEVEGLSVTAQPEESGTSIAVHLDRRGTLAVVQVPTLLGFVLAACAGVVLTQEVAPAVGAAAVVSGMGGTLALARSYWASSTRKARERINGLVDALGRVISQPESPSSGSTAIGDSSGLPRIEVKAPGDSGES